MIERVLERMFQVTRFKNLFYEITIGLVKRYMGLTTGLAKIEFTYVYVKLVKLVRQYILATALVCIFAMLFLNVLVVIEVTVLLFAPWPVFTRVVVALLTGIVGSMVPISAVLLVFSQKRWMEMTGTDDFVEKSLNGSA